MSEPCNQEARLKRIETMQTGFGNIIRELRGVLLPDELHPDNGLINQVRYMKDSIKEQAENTAELSATVKVLTEAVGELKTVISGINKYMEANEKFRIETQTATKIKAENDKAMLDLKDKNAKTLQWVAYTSIVVILFLLGYILIKPT